MPRTTKELADELDARDRLRQRGYDWKSCKHCHGIGRDARGAPCFPCGGKGGTWMAPMMRAAHGPDQATASE